MIVPDWMIRELSHQNVVVPFEWERVQPASIDLTFGNSWHDYDGGRTVEGAEYRLLPGCAVLAATAERVHLPAGVAGLLVPKSSLSRRGVLMPGGWVDPGYVGTLSVLLAGYGVAQLREGEPFCQMVLMRVAGVPNAIYNGRYQNSEGVVVAK